MNTNLASDIRELTIAELDAIAGAALCVKFNPSMTRCLAYSPNPTPKDNTSGAGPVPTGAGPAPTGAGPVPT